MKQDFIERIRLHLNQDISEQYRGFGQWLAPRVMALEADGLGMVLAQDIRPNMLNPLGIMHGGALAGLMDEAMGFQLFLLTPHDQAFVAQNLQVDFLKAGASQGVLIAKPEVLRQGRTTAYLRCRIEDEQGRLLSLASSHYVRFQPR